jgi:hypothetical protein
MIIKVNKNYRIISNPTCWQVEQRKSDRKDGSARWEPLYYHTDFQGALISVAELQIRTIPDAATAEEIKATLRTIRDECVAASKVFRELSV